MNYRVVSYHDGWKVQTKRFGLFWSDVCWSGHPEHSEPLWFRTSDEAQTWVSKQ